MHDILDKDIFLAKFGATCYHRAYFALYHVLQRKQIELDQNLSIFQGTKIPSSVRYNIWGFDCFVGPCLLFDKFNEYKNVSYTYLELMSRRGLE